MENFDSLLTDVFYFGIIIIAVVFGLYLLFAVLIKIYKILMRLKILQEHRFGVLYKISLPRYRHNSDISPEKSSQVKSAAGVAEQMFAELRGIIPTDWKKHLVYRETISFEITATATEINFYVFSSKKLSKFVKDVVFSAYPEAEIQQVPDYYDSLVKNNVRSGYVRLVGHPYSPIRTYDTFSNDSINSILNKMINLRGKEMVAVQFYLTPVTGNWRERAHDYLNYLQNESFGPSSNHPKSQDNATGTMWLGETPKMRVVDKDLYLGVEKKMGKDAFLVGIRVVCCADNPNTAQSHFNWIAKSFSQYDMPPLTTFEPYQFFLTKWTFLDEYKLRLQPLIDWPIFRQQFIANTQELATLFHLPSEDTNSPKIAWQKYKTAPPPIDIPAKGIFLGYNRFRGEQKPIFMQKEDRRRHFYIVGQTGTGKSQYLKNLFLQDVNNNEGACFIDPHGEEAEDLIGKIPKERIQDVVYWDPSDVDFPVAMNILDAQSIEEKNIIINSFIALLYKLYDPNRTGIMGPMLERTIRNVMLTAMEEKGNTLVEALRLLISPDFAKSKIDFIKDPLIKTYWTEQLARTTEFHKSETLGYFISKFDRFISDVTIRNIIGQSNSVINFDEIINEGKILIINLAKGTLGEENTSFLGMLIIPKFMIAAMKRTKIPQEKRRDFYLYIDEFQNFAIPDFVTILSEARKFRLNLIVANQYISQIREDVRDAVFGNVGTLGAFRVGTDDAKYLTQHYSPILNEFDLINNGIGNLYLKPIFAGKPAEPFSVSFSWKEIEAIKHDVHTADLIRWISRIKYGKPRNLVEKETFQRAKLLV